MTYHLQDTHPKDGHFVLLKLVDGSEVEGWYDPFCGWYRRGNDFKPYRVVGWRELGTKVIVPDAPIRPLRRFDLTS